jgi:hypothetical protein
VRVLGRKIDLPGGRIVYLGRIQDPEDASDFGIVFRSRLREDLYITISREALEALGELIDDYRNSTGGTPTVWKQDFPHKTVWEIITAKATKESRE